MLQRVFDKSGAFRSPILHFLAFIQHLLLFIALFTAHYLPFVAHRPCTTYRFRASLWYQSSDSSLDTLI